MNNLRLLAVLLVAVLPGASPCLYAADAAQGEVLTLEELFRVAEGQSSRLRAAKAADRQAHVAADAARSARLPDVSASLQVSYIGDGFTTKRDFSDYQRAPIPHLGTGVGVEVAQPVYSGGAISASIAMAELRATAACYATDAARADMRFALTGYYLDIYRFTILRRVVEQNAGLARQVLAQMHARHDQGTALRNDITRYELLVSDLDLHLVKIDNTLSILRRNLAVTAGLDEGAVVEPDTTILLRSLPVEGEEAWRDDALRNSPALKLSRQGVAMSRRAEDLTRADMLPKVGLKAAWTLDGPILVEIPPVNRNLSYWYVGVGVSYNLSSLWKARRSLAADRAATFAAQQELEAATDRTGMAIHADYTRYMEAYEELKTQHKSVELAESNYAVTATRYDADMALITDMVDAANAKLDAEQRLVDAKINIIYYYYKLLFTSGKI